MLKIGKSPGKVSFPSGLKRGDRQTWLPPCHGGQGGPAQGPGPFLGISPGQGQAQWLPGKGRIGEKAPSWPDWSPISC